MEENKETQDSVFIELKEVRKCPFVETYFILTGIVYKYRTSFWRGRIKRKIIAKKKVKCGYDDRRYQTNHLTQELKDMKEYYLSNQNKLELNFSEKFRIVLEKCTRTITFKKKS